MEGKGQGKIIYIYPVEKVSEKFSKRGLGVDMSIEYKGRKINDYLHIEAVNEQANLFIDKEDENFLNSTAIKEGDEIEFEVEVGNYQTNADSKKGNRTVIYNNVKLISVKRSRTAAAINHQTTNQNTGGGFALPDEKPF